MSSIGYRLDIDSKSMKLKNTGNNFVKKVAPNPEWAVRLGPARCLTNGGCYELAHANARASVRREVAFNNSLSNLICNLRHFPSQAEQGYGGFGQQILYTPKLIRYPCSEDNFDYLNVQE